MTRASGEKQKRTFLDFNNNELLYAMAFYFYKAVYDYKVTGNVGGREFLKISQVFLVAATNQGQSKKLMSSAVNFSDFFTTGLGPDERKQKMQDLIFDIRSKFSSPGLIKQFAKHFSTVKKKAEDRRAAAAQVAADGSRDGLLPGVVGSSTRARAATAQVATEGGIATGGGGGAARRRAVVDVAADSNPVVAAVPRPAIVLDDDGRGGDTDVDAPALEVNSKFVKDALKAINSKKYGSNGIFNSPSVTVKVGFTSVPCDSEIVGVSADDPRKKVVDAFNHLVALNEALKSSAPESRGFFARSRQAGDVAIAQEDIRSNLEAFNAAVKEIGFSEEVNDAVQLGQAAKFLKDKIKSAQFPSAAIEPLKKERVAGFAPSGFPSQAEVSIAVRTGQEK